jgi:hypothetical protein
MKSRRMRWVGHIACTKAKKKKKKKKKKKNADRILVENKPKEAKH